MEPSITTEIIERLARIEEKLNVVVDHEKRIRSLEQWRWLIVGGGVVVGFLIQFVKP